MQPRSATIYWPCTKTDICGPFVLGMHELANTLNVPSSWGQLGHDNARSIFTTYKTVLKKQSHNLVFFIETKCDDEHYILTYFHIGHRRLEVKVKRKKGIRDACSIADILIHFHPLLSTFIHFRIWLFRMWFGIRISSLIHLTTFFGSPCT